MYSRAISNDLRRYLFPTEEEISILRLVLTRDPGNRERWKRFCQGHPDPRQVLGSIEGRYRRMLAFLHHGIVQNSIELPKQWESYFRIALTRETARMIAYWKQTSEVLDYLREGGIPAILIRGAGPALQAYPKGLPRHSHDVDLLVPSSLRIRARELLEEKQFTPREFIIHNEHRLLGLQHPSELEFVLNTAVKRYDGSCEELDGLQEEVHTVAAPVPGLTFPVLAPTMCLLHVLQQFYEPPSEKSLYLFMDLFYLTRKPSLLDIDRLGRQIEERQLCLGCRLALDFLNEIESPLDSDLRAIFETLGANAKPHEYARATQLLRYDKWRIMGVIVRGEGLNRILIDYCRQRLVFRLGLQKG